jgi:hypothetical protein
LAATPLNRFEPVDIPTNRCRIEARRQQDCLIAYRTPAAYWGKQRTVIVTYTPATARKQTYTFDDNPTAGITSSASGL